MPSILLHTHLFIALCAIALSWGTQNVLGLPPIPIAYYGIVGLGTICVYNLHRAYGLTGIDMHMWPPRFVAFYRFRYLNLLISSLAVVLIVWLLLSHPILWNWALLPPVALAILYILPLRNGQNLRQIPFLKIFIIAITWVWVTAWLPLIITDSSIDPWHGIFLAHRFFFIFAITMPFDIRDVYTDRNSDVKTLPSYYGIRRSKLWAIGISVLAFLLLLPLFNSQDLPLTMAPLYFLVFAGSVVGIYWSSPQRSEWYFGYLLDGLMLFMGGMEVWAS